MKKLFILTTSILLLAAACQKQVVVQPAQNQPAQTSPSALQQPQATSTDATANWKTYTNDSLGFSFKYPANWSANLELTSDSSLDFVVLYMGGDSVGRIGITTYIKTIDDWVKDKYLNSSSTIQSITIGGQTGKEVHSDDPSFLNGEAAVIYKGRIYIFNNTDAMKQAGVLSSFKFTK